MSTQIFTKNTRLVNGQKEYEVRQFGHNSYVSEKDFLKAVSDGLVFFKANKPVHEKDLAQF